MPTQKSPQIENTLTKLTGISRQEASDAKICTWCKREVLGFKDDLSVKEYNISGFCQKCQDETFG